MKQARLIQALVIVVGAWCCGLLAAQAETIEQLRQRLEAGPGSSEAKEALAEAYLVQCELEKSLELWRELLAANPDHERARFVVSRLTLAALDLDSHLQVIETLIDKGQTKGTDFLLDAASRRAATAGQKAHILYLRGQLSRRTKNEAQSRASFESAVKLYPDTVWGARAAIALAESRWAKRSPGEAQRLLRGVVLNEKLDEALRQEAKFKLLLVDSADWTGQRRIATLRQLLSTVTEAGVKRQVLEKIVHFTVRTQGRWVPEAVEAAGSVLQNAPPYEQANRVLSQLTKVARNNQDAGLLDTLLAVLSEVELKEQVLARRADFVRVEALISRVVVETDVAAMRRFLAEADETLEKLEAAGTMGWGEKQLWQLRGRLYLVEAQKLVTLAGATEALPAVMRAKSHYLAALPVDRKECLERLKKIGVLLEHVQEWEVAAAMYREVADGFAHTPQGRDMLLRITKLYEQHLNSPMSALDVYAEYAARYPAEVSYRQLDIGRRLQRFGYVNVLDFQKRMGLKPDGVAGPQTRKRLSELEAGFDMISIRGNKDAGVLRGEFIHPTMFRIARQLEQAGRHYDAIKAYLLVLNLFPTKREADDALLAVARLFRDNMLFEEALGAYEELMQYFPKGNVTSKAYIESASCLENLGRWKKAKQLYQLYIKKFPKYKHVGLCKERIALLDEMQQYQDFHDNNPQHAKAAEAQYQISVILHKKLENYTKAAVEFGKVAELYPGHVRAPDALFTAGVAHLRTENFPAARNLFEQVLRRYPESRLADDAQYWTGHTYEYSARALGKLDKRRIVLKRRSLRHRARLLADVELRRRFYGQAEPGPQMPEHIWTTDALGVLTSGSKRDRVNAELFQAVGAYREVVDKFKMGDMAGNALHRIGVIYTKYLKDPEKGFKAYQELLEHYPRTREAIDALYEVGAYYLEKEKFDKAVKFYRQFIYNYPNDSRVASAMVAIAGCYMEKKQWDKALDAYQSYLNKFPRGKEADLAKAQITWIRTYHY
ncbi:MAG: tetratricopeptide repeat protein [Planctomycetota bacterium]|jgi:TolA-binding protein